MYHAGKAWQEQRCHDLGREDCSLVRAHLAANLHPTASMRPTMWGTDSKL